MSALNLSNPACKYKTKDSIHTPRGEWALIHKGELAGLYSSSVHAWNDAAARFRSRHCQVRPVGASEFKIAVASFDLASSESRLMTAVQRSIRAIGRLLFPARELSY